MNLLSPFKMPGPYQFCYKRPKDVGIIAMEMYFPSQYVDQTELEQHDGVAAGQYTSGLGQACMGFFSDREDIISLCLTVVNRLMERNGLSYSHVYRLEVSTDALACKSNFLKEAFKHLFKVRGDSTLLDINICEGSYGGTAALLNAVDWVKTSSWDGGFALVVAGGILVYPPGSGRPTRGAGAVAMLVGQNAPLAFERGLRETHFQHIPDLMYMDPVVDDKVIIRSNLVALDQCYSVYREKIETQWKQEGLENRFSLEDFGYLVLQSPFCKLVQKSLARLMLNDFLNHSSPNTKTGPFTGLDAFRNMRLEDTYFNQDVEEAFTKASADLFERKTKTSLMVSEQNGDMFTASVFGCLASVLAQHTPSQIAGQRIGLFSYGSGFASTLYSLHVTKDHSPGSTLDKLVSSLSDLKVRLASWRKVPPSVFSEDMKLRAETQHLANYVPQGSVDDLFPGTWYLTRVGDNNGREYARKPLEPGLQVQPQA